ncbi:MAG: 5-deoxy-glucuronate isomerase [Planctomycetes bacterium]|nr:5-deoxy-glucuronate isomerase [Planctomycetota bacterium]
MIRTQTQSRLLVKPHDDEAGFYHSITAESAGWSLLNFKAKTLRQGEAWSENTGEMEYAIVLLAGNFSVDSSRGSWTTVNGRRDVFSGLAHALYLPRQTQFTLRAESEALDIACGYCATDQDHPARFITPEAVHDMGIEIRGGDNATRQINSILPPGSDCHRLVCVEVYTPSGNWSSFPAHKHDERKLDANGDVLEACLEETYFYKIDKPQGFAIQRIYNDDKTMDELALARGNDVVLVPSGYHPVAAGPGYNVYYLNFLAGTDQLLTATQDPDHAWVYDSWQGVDPRVPMVTLDMNNQHE